tara:strand:+ start:1231 stop:1683 length:453 start_codon:yes stop_codon:yes gene_type:complete
MAQETQSQLEAFHAAKPAAMLMSRDDLPPKDFGLTIDPDEIISGPLMGPTGGLVTGAEALKKITGAVRTVRSNPSEVKFLWRMLRSPSFRESAMQKAPSMRITGKTRLKIAQDEVRGFYSWLDEVIESVGLEGVPKRFRIPSDLKFTKGK